MKKRFAGVLCAIMLLSVSPVLADTRPSDSVSPRIAVGFTVSVNKTAARVGDVLTWSVSNLQGAGPFNFSYDIYKDGTIYQYDDQWRTRSLFSWEPLLAGSYKVKVSVKDPVNNTIYESFSPATKVSLRAFRISSVTAVNGSSLKVSWNRMPGAKGYEVWIATAKAGPYTLVKTTAATSFSNTYRKTGVRYYYKVAAYTTSGGSRYYLTPLSAPVSGVALGKARVTGAGSASAARLTITWTPVPEATGYRVLRSTSPGGVYTRVAATTAAAFTNTGLTRNRTYYYKIQAYKRIGTTNYLGPVSAYRAGKVK